MATAQAATSYQWQTARVMTFAGQHDTHIRTGEDYPTITLGDLFALEPARKVKHDGPAFVPSSFCDYNGRNHEAQRAHGSFVSLVGDVDKGDLTLEQVRKAIAPIVGSHAWLIYSSAHSRPGDRRWRIIVPLEAAMPFGDWFDAQQALFALLEQVGVPMDRALGRAGQPVYLPNVPRTHPKSDTPLRGDDGTPLYFERASSDLEAPGLHISAGPLGVAIQAMRLHREHDDAERERIRQEAARKRASAPKGDSASLITDFNASNSVATMLEMYGYSQSPRHDDDWRSPHQEGDTYATRVFDGHWISLSGSDAAAGVGAKCATGCYGDAYDLYVHYEHRGDHKAAWRALGEERRAAQPNVIYGVFPEDQPGDPGWMPEDVERWSEPQEMPPETIDVAPTASDTADANTLPLEWFDDISAQLEANWLVDDFVPSGGLCLVYGHPGCGKSFFALDLTMHVSAGTPWRGRDTKQGLVIYVGAEGQRGLRQRIAAFRQHYEVQGLPFALIPVEVNMLEAAGDCTKLAATIRQAAERFGIPVAMIVFDTLARTFGGGDEVGTDMVTYINNVGRLQIEFSCGAVVIHHRPKDSANESPRGHGSLWGACDTIILVEDKNGQKTARITKQKDAEVPDPVDFDLKVVELGQDEKGRDVTSCVVVEPKTDRVQNLPYSGPKLTDQQKICLDALHHHLEEEGGFIGHGVPEDRLPKGRMVKVARQSGWAARTTAGLCGPDSTPDTAARNWRRYKDKFQALGIIGVYDEWVWIIRDLRSGADK